MRLGAVIRGWRERERYGIREAAKMIGVSSATLSRIERGKNCDGRSVFKLLDWLLHDRAPLPSSPAAKEKE